MSIHMNVHSTNGITVAKSDGPTCTWIELGIQSESVHGNQHFEITLFFEPGNKKLRDAIFKALKKCEVKSIKA